MHTKHNLLFPAASVYVYAHKHADHPFGRWELCSALWAAGTSLLLHLCSYQPITWQAALAYALGLPAGLLLWPGLAAALRCISQLASTELRDQIATLLDAGHWAGAPGQQAPRMAAMLPPPPCMRHATDDPLHRPPSIPADLFCLLDASRVAEVVRFGATAISGGWGRPACRGTQWVLGQGWKVCRAITSLVSSGERDAPPCQWLGANGSTPRPSSRLQSWQYLTLECGAWPTAPRACRR